MIGITEQQMRAVLESATRGYESGLKPEELRQLYIDATVKLLQRNNAAIETYLKSQARRQLLLERNERDWD